MSEVTDQELVDEVLEYDETIETLRGLRAALVSEIEARLDAKGARVLAVDGATVERPLGTAVYDYGTLAGLRETLSPAELGKAYTAPHDEYIPASVKTVEEKWNGTQLNKLAKDLGGDVRETIERATTRNPMPVRITKAGD